MPRNAEPEPVPSLILVDLPCAGCGFNLRGLMSDRECPDCGAPASRSIPSLADEPAPGAAAPPIGACAPPTLPRPRGAPVLSARARRGFTLVLWSIGAEILVALAMLAAGVGLSVSLGQLVWAGLAALSLAEAGARIVEARGWWLITGKEAFGAAASAARLARGVCRVMVLLHLGASILSGLAFVAVCVLALTGDGWPVNFGGFSGVPMFFEALLGTVAYASKLLVLVRLGGWMGGAAFLGAARLWLWLGPALLLVGWAWRTVAAFVGVGFTGARLDAFVAPVLWVLAAAGCWGVVRAALGALAGEGRRGNP